MKKKKPIKIKITCLIDKELLDKAMAFSGAKNITDTVICALSNLNRSVTINLLMDSIKEKPMKFNKTAVYLRTGSRRK